ncbi:spore coat associated protein CotJA [Alicyclobacillus acidoterrestris]|uniref:Spore coat associated protein CotJA n=1 Tax=Alicyclobacillus acidoterrestris (strain ATCC 49025 / DSM 3922 / CIP 106132 / NCIMB 13137 / GD3B) TaxID=1356854 RepID=A0A9E7CT44_ALIAG|nr:MULTISPECIES: spore coat associated protein CotJA [Alicyclobacillus]UNO50740.1 spore coat associated protein CotJA [Alicyclobacillus acidoterrestris]
MNIYIASAPFLSPFQPCPALPKAFIVPPNQYITFQPSGLEQFSSTDALKHGTLWAPLYSPYNGLLEATKKW